MDGVLRSPAADSAATKAFEKNTGWESRLWSCVLIPSLSQRCWLETIEAGRQPRARFAAAMSSAWSSERRWTVTAMSVGETAV
jgi:hypothetical protein